MGPDTYKEGYDIGLAEGREYREALLARVEELEEAGSKVQFWRHHEDCNPLTMEGCRCGLLVFQSLLTTEEPRREK